MEGHVEALVKALLGDIEGMTQLHDAPGEIPLEPGQPPAQQSTDERIAAEAISSDQEHWRRLATAWQKFEYVQGIILDQVEGGFTVDLGGVVALLPASQVDIGPSADVTRLKNAPQTFQIMKMDRERGIVVSRRVVLETIRFERMKQLEEGQVVEGVVDDIFKEGAFIDLGGHVVGMLLSSDIAWRRVNHPSEVLSIGQPVQVKIIKIDPERPRAWVGIKQLLDDPWEGIEAKLPVGDHFKGRVTDIQEYGTWVELEAGVKGLLHVSEMASAGHDFHPEELVSIGQEIDVRILEVDAVKRRISLRTQQAARLSPR